MSEVLTRPRERTEMAPASNGALMSFIERASKDPDFDVNKFEVLLRLQRDVSHDQARRAFNQAMADAQAEMQPVVRDAKNSHLGNRYAKLETIDAAMRPIYTRHGFSVRYGSAPAPGAGSIRLTCTVAHADGYFEENYLDAPLVAAGSQGGRTQTTPVQAVGSAVTYLRRYLLGMVFNIVLADDDDDGEATRRPQTARAPVQSDMARPTARTWGQVKAGIVAEVDAAQSIEDINRLLTSYDVVTAKRKFPDGSPQRTELDGILARGIAAHAPREEPEDDFPGEPAVEAEAEMPPPGTPEAEWWDISRELDRCETMQAHQRLALAHSARIMAWKESRPELYANARAAFEARLQLLRATAG